MLKKKCKKKYQPQLVFVNQTVWFESIEVKTFQKSMAMAASKTSFVGVGGKIGAGGRTNMMEMPDLFGQT